MHPILFSIGDFHFRTYTLTSIVAMVISMVVVRSEVRRLKWPIENPIWFTAQCTLLGWVGAHLLYAITRFNDYDWLPWLKLTFIDWGHGNVWFGGFLLTWGFIHVVAKRKGIPILAMWDVGCFAANVALAFGRWGCFFGGCCYGSPTDLPTHYWVPNREGYTGWLHPTPVYEFTFLMIVFAWLWRRRKRNTYDGQTAVNYLLTTSLGRIVIECFRGDTIRGFVLGPITTSQFLGLALFITGVVFHFRFNPKYKAKQS
ncbi:MAG: prolipoprotein diacylglyceryl transferase [Deltaproteobacteria bacterium]|nr:prolipoprotein diacylglyceryl transferase [Deltaproteobacteria bacterium]